MASLSRTLEIRTSPHILSGYSVDTIMFNVVLALLPTTAFAVYAFGLAALLTLATAVLACLAAEYAACRLAGRPSTLGDWSAAITGLLYGLTLPPGLPLWMVAVGGVVGLTLGKSLFGGLGYNAFNPALFGRAFLQAAFPVAMTSWVPAFSAARFSSLPGSTLTLPFSEPVYDAISGATPLASWKFDRELAEVGDLALGFVGGSAGETSGLLILLGGAYLVARNMMNWRIPAGVFAAVALTSGVLHLVDPQSYASPFFMLFSGGLMLGAVFMATDMVASPMTSLGCFVYGALIGLVVVVIRIWGGMPEGVMYAILLANAVSPHIDQLIRPTVYGTTSGKGGGMTQEQLLVRPPPPNTWHMYRALVGVSLLCGLLIVTVFGLTRPMIERNQAEALRRAIFQVLPRARSTSAFRLDEARGFEILDAEPSGEPLVHACYDEERRLVGFAVEAEGMGYQDVIRLLYGYSIEEDAITGIRVLESRETPGLGDKIETDAEFLANFERLDVSLASDLSGLVNPIEFVKPGAKQHPWQIDGITGATVSSTAVADILRKSSAHWVPRIRRNLDDFAGAQ